MNVLEQFKTSYTDFKVFSQHSYIGDWNYKKKNAKYNELFFTYIVSKNTFKKFKKIIGVVDHEFLEEGGSTTIDIDSITNDDILDIDQMNDLKYTISEEEFESLNYIIKENLSEESLEFLSKECFELLKSVFPKVKTVKKVLYKASYELKVEMYNPMISVVFLYDKFVTKGIIKPFNFDEYKEKILISRFMNGKDLKNLLTLIGKKRGFKNIDYSRLLIPEYNELEWKDKQLLLKGELGVVEVLEQNLSSFKIYKDKLLVFYYREYGTNFEIQFNNIQEGTSTDIAKTDDDSKSHSLTQNKYKMNLEDDFSGKDNDGKIGLSNIGNTCFMNSALQCMLHTDIIKEFIMQNNLKEEINIDNPLGSKGELLISFSDLFKKYWKTSGSRISPYEFKRVMNKHLVTFEGYGQHDSQEFLSQMLDALHEDVNRIIKKPYTTTIEGKESDLDIEVARKSWVTFLKRNYSIFTENFFGQFKSTVSCPKCRNTSVTFDPFQIISLPIPIVVKDVFSFYFVFADHIKKAIKFTFKAKSSHHFSDIPLDKITSVYAKTFKVDKNRLRFAFLGFSKCGEILNIKENLAQLHNLSELLIASKPKVFLLELNDEDMKNKDREDKLEVYLRTNYELYDEKLNTLNKYSHEYKRLKRDFNEDPIFTKFLYLTKNHTIRDLYIATLRKFFHKTSLFRERNPDHEEPNNSFFEKLWELLETKMKDKRFFYLDINGKKCGSDTMNDKLKRYINGNENENKLEVNVFLYLPKNTTTKIDISKFVTCAVSNKEDFLFESDELKNYKNKYSIDDLLSSFSQPETLDEKNKWFCSQCKAHVFATKKIEIYKSPKYLIIHLKKLKYQAKKIPLITFPKNNLQMDKYVLNKSSIQDYNILKEEFINGEQIQFNLKHNKQFIIEDKKPCKGLSYDLYGVVNHFGSQNFGHYTSSVKVNGEWFEFNDSSVHSADERDVVGDGAYILFYKKNA